MTSEWVSEVSESLEGYTYRHAAGAECREDF